MSKFNNQKADSKNSNFTNHNFILENRKILKLSGIVELGSFDEKSTIIFTNSDKLVIHGTNLKVEKLSVETGELEISGKINMISYTDKKNFSPKNIFARIFKRK